MDIQQTIDDLKEQINDLQSELGLLRRQAHNQANNLWPAGVLYSVQTRNGGFEKIFPNLDEAVEYYSTLRKRLLEEQARGTRASVEIELHKTKMLYKRHDWEQF